jgi:hypothetical protein
MGQNNLDKDIKKLLDTREIQPSLESWDRLNAMLSTAESTHKNNNTPFYWLRIAAVMVVMLGIVLLWFVNDESKINKIDNVNNINAVTEVNDTNKASRDTTDREDFSKSIDPIKQIDFSNKVIVQKNATSQNSHKVYDAPKQNPMIKNEQETTLNEQIIVVQSQKGVALAEIQPSTENKEEPLLKQKLKVDPNMLLEQVENEQKITFRQKVFKTIKKGYQEAKVAISTRNQESSNNNQ